ncbi:hypothetical protein FSP39_008203 [Pinctada imbricata]|uniref:G-protein coupled receptors family 1 profile domain-containing protein n=1 Tax=Pinctada imbricata TaxID=66713 RepID=A0AA88Y3T3_PINIB|nr:hypothetical protein FSP39_008203 [Pinctada imbricata]
MQSFNTVFPSNGNGTVPLKDSGVIQIMSDGTYVFLAVFLFSVFVFGAILNGAVIYVFCTLKSVKMDANYCILALCVCGFMISTLGVPFAAASSLAHKWLFGKLGCSIHAAIFTALGITMIALLTLIAVDRYCFIVKYSTIHKLTNRTMSCLIVACFMYGSLWGTFPLVGWSSYTTERGNISCSVDWEDRHISSLSYCISLMIAGLILPVIVISYVYAQVVHLLHKRRSTSQRLSLRGSSQRRKAIRRETRVARTIFLMIGAFILSWFPYAIFSTVALIGYQSSIPAVVQTLPSVFAKSSVLWNPLIYAMRNRSLRKGLVATFPCLHFIKRQRAQLHRTPVTQLSLQSRPNNEGSDGTDLLNQLSGEFSPTRALTVL